ncbi:MULTISPECIES: hypothetical protein [unclassified Rhizobium]|uniref:hypothetical protein n=1 Tax=unclassified Rhizobium TaxID=2613769 RepID=UPI0007EB1429|nr:MULTISPECIES: hypothetical protein [unclassified Rhizobium]ANM09239.1 hypothetical protein AMK05_CH00810 [Rhizobium sp. N324]OYD02807.1 hypothetical protein AMK08_CH100806 [Rhizobium sp. N4311]
MAELVPQDRTVFVGRLDGVPEDSSREDFAPGDEELAKPFEAASFGEYVDHYHPVVETKASVELIGDNSGKPLVLSVRYGVTDGETEPYQMLRSFDPGVVALNATNTEAADPNSVEYYPLLQQALELDAIDEIISVEEWRKVVEAGPATIEAQLARIDEIIERYESAA